MAKSAIILLSGGLDSTTTLAIAKDRGYKCHALSFDYGQRNRVELEAAAKVVESLGAESHVVIKVDLGAFGGSALTDKIDVPKSDTLPDNIKIPVTYVPARNTVFLSLALAYAETLNSGDIFIGVNALDYSGYPDCRPEYIEAFGKMANLATKAATEGKMKVTIHTPLISMSKKEIIETGLKLNVDYSITVSCYDPSDTGTPCGHCDSCLLRSAAFTMTGVNDPALPG